MRLCTKFAHPRLQFGSNRSEQLHDAIIEQDLFDRVQQQLTANARRVRKRSVTRMSKAPLTGKLFDANGEPMSPTFSRGKSGKSYRYYVSASLQQGASPGGEGLVQRLPASAIEHIVGNAAARWLAKSVRNLDLVEKVRLATDGIVVELNGGDLIAITTRLEDGERVLHSYREKSAIHLPLALPFHGGKRSVARGDRETTRPDPVLIAALRKAHSMLSQEGGLPSMDAGPASRYDANILRLAFLAPDIQRDILDGRQPASLNVQTFRKIDLPLAWSQQRTALGYNATI